MDNVFNAMFGRGTGFGDALARAESRMPKVPTNYTANMLSDDLAYARKELRLAMDRLAEAHADVRKYQAEVREAEAALRAKGLQP